MTSSISILLLIIIQLGSTRAFTCEYCVENTFCYQNLNESCPTHSSSPSGSSNLTDCTCNAGYYAISTGSSLTCHTCLDNYYCPGGGDLLPCVQFSSSVSGSSTPLECVCNEGYEGMGNTTCDACAAGKYKTSTSSKCVQCPVNTYSTQEAATSIETCTSCPSLTTSVAGSTDVTQCVSQIGTFSAGPGEPAQSDAFMSIGTFRSRRSGGVIFGKV